MRKEIIIRMRPGSERYHKRALKVAAGVRGVKSVTMTSGDMDLLLVIGDGVDESALTKKLRKEVGEAEIVDLRTLAAGTSASAYLPGTSRDVVAAQSRSPHHWHSVNTPGRDLPVGGRVSYPSPLVSPGAARWQGEQYRQAEAGYYPHAPSPSPSYYHASPLAAHGGYGHGGSSYARAAARSHPGNYSPMVDRHDYHAAVSRQHRHGGGTKHKCCSIQ